MGIVDEDVATVRQAADLATIVGQYTQLRRVGTRLTGLCPFHSEKTPSFSVNPVEGLYKCFGCGLGGDVITFVREKEHLDFVGAVEWLAAKSGVTLRYTDRNEGENRKKRDALTDALNAAVDWYHDRLLSAPDAAAARKYLRSRGIEGEVVRRYRIGWAPDAWDELVRGIGLPTKVVVDSGLGLVNRRQRLQDFFRGRIMFPIFDDQGRPISFGGRVLPGDDGPKYLNTADTALYRKSRTLYGLNWHKEEIVRADQVVVCEGYTDVIGCAEAGVRRAVATCGTALTSEHIRAMKRFAHRVVLAFDADAAGQAAAARVYEWEKELDVDVAVADLPSGVDPADLAREDPARLVAAVEGAIPLLGFRVDRALSSADLATPSGRARAAGNALDVITEHPDPLVRDQYLMDVAARCRTTPDQLREIAANRSRPAPVRRVDRPAELRSGSISDSPELEALRLLVSGDDEIADFVHPALFRDVVIGEAFAVVTEVGDVHTAIAAASPPAAELLVQVAVEETGADPRDVGARLLDRAATVALAELEAEAHESADPLSYASLNGWLKLRIEALRMDGRPVPPEELAALRSWLLERAEVG